MKKKREISKEEFLNYLNSDNGKEKHAVEKASLSDPFMQEALEGFEGFPEPQDAIFELDQRLKPAKNWRALGVAASIIFLFSAITIWVITLSSETGMVAMENVKKQEKIVSPSPANSRGASDSAISLNKDTRKLHSVDSDGNVMVNEEVSPERAKESEELDNLNEKPALKDLPSPMIQEADKNTFGEKSLSRSGVQLDSMPVLDREIITPTSIAKGEINESKEVEVRSVEVQQKRKESARSNKKATNKDAKAPASTSWKMEDALAPESSTSSQGPSVSDQLNEAKDLYEKQDFLKSLDVCKKILAENPNQDNALFYAGMNEKKLKNSQKSILYFEKVPKNSAKYFDARWELYELLSSEPDKANAILKELASQPNAYQERAKQLLK
jgi:hypothetical protein